MPRLFLEERFQDYLRHECGYARGTLQVVDYSLIEWQRWLRARFGITRLDVSAVHLRHWLDDQLRRHAQSTVDKKTWVLRRFYAWLAGESMMECDPWQYIAPPRRRPHQQSLGYVPCERTVRRLLEQPDTRFALGMRDRAILELLYSSGLRAAELLSLRPHQLCLRTRAAQVMGKGGKERLVVFGEHSAQWLEHYLREARPALLQACQRPIPALFVQPTASGTLNYSALQRTIRRHADAAGLPMVTAHTLRHAFATHLYQTGANLRVIQMLLGHACLQTTTIYARTSMGYLRGVIERHHPRGILYERQPLGRGASPLSRHDAERQGRD
ncbi:tyrosine-type recombinase/integrase [Acidovorax sp. SUPP3334]|uniref:tyrosine-type recombinase/integrase n=1 Tax=Acidovorax sp. SUPP3334 TaxID=2920881 RepID=UPI0023DE2BD7|nr:tyrosine-type recombinase/integrase [Acidovorax sp. SUPP3334]GKT25094.1 tyrosine-type recombinase/integrase [Acidovorax sp. SUPP3334]